MIASTIEIFWDFSDPFFSGLSAPNTEVFAGYQVALNGRAFQIDWADQALAGPSSIPMLRPSMDTGTRAGGESVTRDDLWVRRSTSWHHGAGQRWMDHAASDEFRFYQSKGIDVWTRDKFKLLADTTHPVTTAAATEMVAQWSVAGTYLYYNDNGTLKYVRINTDDTLGPGGTVAGSSSLSFGFDRPQIASKGGTAWAIESGTNRIDTLVNGAATAGTSTVTLIANAIGHVHGHLVVTGGSGNRSLFDCTAGGAATAFATLSDGDAEWVCLTEGTKVIYAAANTATAGPSRVYQITYDPTVAALSAAPTIAATLPFGERIRAMYGYLGFVFIGTNLGFRMCRENSDGTLTVGSLVPFSAGVKAFAGSGQYVYFGWSNFDATSAGLGRIDITAFTDGDLVPAYASDLMADVTGTVEGIATSDPAFTSTVIHPYRPWFTVNASGGGVYGQHLTDYETTGFLDSGLISYGLAEQKDFSAVDVRTEPLVGGQVSVSLATDGGAPATIDTLLTAGATGAFMPTVHIPGDRHEVRLTLSRGTNTQTPVVTELTTYAWPAVHRGETLTLPVLIHSRTRDELGYPVRFDLWDQILYIRNLAIPGSSPTLLQWGSLSELVHVVDYKTVAIKPTDDGSVEATVRIEMKHLERATAA